MNRLFCTAVLVLTAATALAGERWGETQLPLRRIALYSSGIGYFERSGTVAGDRPLTLHFKTGDMNDVLKSLTAIDLTHGSVSSISYPGPGSSFDDFDISAGMIEFLEEFKGAPVQYRVNNTTLDGFIMGVEESDEKRGDETIVRREYLLVMRPNGEIRRTEVGDISWIGFTDARLNDELRRNLQATFARSYHASKQVLVFSKEPGPRQMLLAYALTIPEWKATYRLVVSDDNSALLQGWAAVENDTDEDWKEVQIALIAGRPLFHQSNLYQGGFVSDWGALGNFGPLDEWGDDDRGIGFSGEQLLQVTTTEAAELFRYDMEYPVTIERDHSALLPIVNRQVEAQPVSVYNQRENKEFPQTAIRMTNTTGLTLEGGPVAVYHSDTFAGDCHTEILRPDQQCYLTHGVDLGTRINTTIDNTEQNVHRVRFHRGSMVAYHRNRCRMVYTFTNRDARDKTVVIEHPVREEWELAGSVRPIERTDQFYRFEALLPSRGKLEIPVVEETRVSTTYEIEEITVRENYIDDDLRETLNEIVALRESAEELEKELTQMADSRSIIFTNQQRLRENLQALGDTAVEANLRERYIAIMNEEEDTLRNINMEMQDVRKQLQAIQNLLKAAIRELDREYEPK